MSTDPRRIIGPLPALVLGVVAALAASPGARAQDDAILWTYDAGG